MNPGIDSMMSDRCYLPRFNFKDAPNAGDQKGGRMVGKGTAIVLLFNVSKNKYSEGAFQIQGNVAEMTSVKGVAKGGSYAHYACESYPGKVNAYTGPQPWLGLRCIMEVKRKQLYMWTPDHKDTIPWKHDTSAEIPTAFAYGSLMYGSKVYRDNFYNQLNTPAHHSLATPVRYAGISASMIFDTTGRKILMGGYYSYAQVIPQPVWINGNEKAMLTGFVFSAGLSEVNFFRQSKVFNLLLTAGFNTGRLRMFRNELLDQKNPFFSPKIGVEPVFKFGHYFLSLKGEADYDISGTHWRRMLFTSSNKLNLNSFQQSGWTTLICFGKDFD
jgi:hypothetical protein